LSRMEGSAGFLSRSLVAAAVLWFVGVVSIYYNIHRPVEDSQIQVLIHHLITLLVWVGTIVNVHALGSLFLKDMEGFKPAVLASLRIGLGLFLLSLFLLALGAFSLYRTWLFWLLWVIPLPWSVPVAYRSLQWEPPELESMLAKASLAFLVLAVGLALMRSLLPPTAWDSLVYHLTGPELYRRAGQLSHDVNLPYLGFPQAGSMLFLWGTMLTGSSLAQLMHFTFMPLTLILTADLAQRVAPGKRWFAAAALSAVPTLWMLASWAYVEWMSMYAGAAALMCLLLPGEGKHAVREWKPYFLAGFFSAFAFSTKYTTAGLLFGLLLAVVYLSRSPRIVLVFAAGALLGMIPTFVKNGLLTGNPVYPFFFDGLYWDASRRWWYSRFGTGLSVLEVLLSAIQATLFGVEGGVVGAFPAYGSSIGPLMLALVPMNLLRKPELLPQRRILAAVMLIAGGGYFLWLIQIASSSLLVQTRLLMPVFPMLAVLAAAGLSALEMTSGWGRSAAFVTSGLCVFVLALTAFAYLSETAGDATLGVVVGEETSASYRLRKLGGYVIAMDEVNQLPDGAVIRFLWEPRSYDCREGLRCEPDALLDQWWHIRQEGLQAEEIAETWRVEGVTHVLLFRDGMNAVRQAGFDPFTSEDWAQLEHFQDVLLEPVWAELDSYGLYALTESLTP